MEDWIDAKDAEIRAGNGLKVRRELTLRIARRFREPIPREYTAAIAALCRRTGIPLQGLLILHRWVRPGPREALKPTDAESVEYGGALAQVGAEQEALGILDKISSRLQPQADLFRAFAYFARWDYGSAIPVLENYIANPLLQPYPRLIGRVNLAAALVIERQHEKANALLAELLSETAEQRQLQGNLLEISAQNAIHLGQFSQASDYLNRAEETLIGGLDRFFVKKWQLILQLYEEGDADLSELRAEARERRDGETLRECDFYEGKITKNKNLLEHCYFGTPFSAYRKQMNWKPAAHYDWRWGSPKKTLDLENPREIKEGQLIHRLICALASDFYKPQHWIGLHAQIFPDRHLNPRSSATVIHQAIKRTRAALEPYQIQIVETQGSYFLTGASAAIRIPLESSVSRELAYLKKMTSNRAYTAQEVAGLWNVRKHTAIRVLNSLQNLGKIERQGLGPSTRYSIRFFNNGGRTY